MKKPWVAELAVDQKLAKHLIESQFPNLKPITLISLGEGWDNVVYRVNNDYVFRFPRRQKAVHFLHAEMQLLPQLTGRFALSIPEIAFFGKPSSDYQWPFIGCRFLQGQTGCKARLSTAERITLAIPLAQFLSTLHATSADNAMALGAKPDLRNSVDIPTRWPKALETLTNLSTLGLPFNSKRLLDLLHSLASIRDTGHRTLIHGDMYARHLLLNQHKNLCGIIDWGDTSIGHPAVDLQLLYSFFPKQAHQLFIDHYGPIDEHTLALALFRAIEHTSIMVLYGHDINDQDLVTEGLVGLQLIADL